VIYLVEGRYPEEARPKDDRTAFAKFGEDED
jgi:hypothetical protein